MAKVLVLGDIHEPAAHPGYMAFCKDLRKKYKTDTTVFIGDVVDHQAVSFHAANPQCAGPTDEYILAKQKIKRWYKAFPNATVTVGNHDCVGPETDVYVQKRGWVPIPDVTCDDAVAQLDGTGHVVFGKPSRVHHKPAPSIMYEMCTRGLSMRTTGNHRVLHRAGSGRFKYTEMAALSQKTTRVHIPVCGPSMLPDAAVSDSSIRLAAWACTDSHRTPGGQWVFYQRLSNVDVVENVLRANGVEYRRKDRSRDITQICGVVLKKPIEVACEMYLTRKSSKVVDRLVSPPGSWPEWVDTLSDRQFNVFLDSVVEADGTRHKRNPYSWMVYKGAAFLGRLQAACAIHNLRSWVTEYRPGHFRLNIHLARKDFRVDGFIRHTEVMPNTDDVYCLTVKHSNFLCRREGTSYFTGNCRVIRLAESVNIPSKYIRDYNEVWKTKTWTWVDEVILDDVYYFHGTGRSGMYPAFNAMKDLLMSVCMGHCHSQSGVKWRANPRQRTFGLDTGCGIDVDAYQFSYGKHMRSRPILSAAVVVDGMPYHHIMPCGVKERYHKSRFVGEST